MNLENRIFFRLTGYLLDCYELWVKARKDAIHRLNALAQELCGPKATAGQSCGCHSVVLPRELKPQDSKKLWRLVHQDDESSWWLPRKNVLLGKAIAKKLEAAGKVPDAEDFVKTYCLTLSASDFSEDGRYYVRASLNELGHVILLSVANSDHNRKALNPVSAIRLRNSEVLAMWENEQEREKAAKHPKREKCL